MSKDEIIKQLRDMAKHPTVTLPRDCEALKAAADLLAEPDQEYKRGYADAMNWKVQNHLEHLPAAQPEQEPVPAAMKTVIEAMQQDPDYAWGWHCNIAMSFVDAGGDHYTGNQGAARFMRTLANVEPAHELPFSPPQRTWVGLTDKEAHELWESTDSNDDWELMKRTEAKLKEKNT